MNERCTAFPDAAETVVIHREAEYDSQAFGWLYRMEEEHFWYRGRRRFLLHAVHRHLGKYGARPPRSILDLGGGCGGWLKYLLPRVRLPIREVVLADSAPAALGWARDCLPASVQCKQVDLLQLPWENRWDVAFLLDVLEHLPEPEAALCQIQRALRPGGYLFVTTPALDCFWSWLDVAMGHQRRYDRRAFQALAGPCGLELLETRYFMFFLSPLYLAARLRFRRKLAGQPRARVRAWVERACKTPWWPINGLLETLFSLETPLGHVVPFPWGTSILAVYRRAS